MLDKIIFLKYQWLSPSGCKDIGKLKSEFVTKTQFLYKSIELFFQRKADTSETTMHNALSHS